MEKSRRNEIQDCPDQGSCQSRVTDRRLFLTGDNNDLIFHGRKDDIIKSGGNRISTKAIETIISRIYAVNEVAVVARPDDLLTNVFCAFIVLKENMKIEVNEILDFMRREVENIYMLPIEVIFKRELPKTANGKIDYSQLI